MSSNINLEDGTEILLDFQKLKKVAKLDAAVIPVAVQDVDSKELLMICYINDKALSYSIENRVAAFWSTSKNKLHIKGETSGDKLQIIDIRVNCEQNSVLYIVSLFGSGSCHTKIPNDSRHRLSCFYRRINRNQLELL